MYYFVHWRPARSGQGREPDLPEDVGFFLLADAGWDTDWGVFRCWFEEAPPSTQRIRRVPEQLATLIASGESYPPALALARTQVGRHFSGQSPSQRTFAQFYIACLQRHLRAQKDAPYILAEATRQEIGYLESGEFCWVLEYGTNKQGQDVVWWVSDDYHVYTNLAEDFILSDSDKIRLRDGIKKSLIHQPASGLAPIE